MLKKASRLKKNTSRIIGSAAVLAITLVLSNSRAPTTLEDILARGVLRVSMVEGSTTYFSDARGPNGFDYLLAKAFAKSLGVKLEVNVMPSLGALLVTLGGPKSDLAASALTATPQRRMRFRFSEPYNHITQKLIYRAGTRRPRSLADLPEDSDLVVLANSSHAERLAAAKANRPNLRWQEKSNTDMLELMEKVHDGEIQFTVVDSDAYAVDRGLYPRAKAAFDLTEPQPVAWAFPNYGDHTLINAANRFLQDYETSGKLKRLRKQLFGHTDGFSIGGSQLLIRRITSRLPKFKEHFIAAAAKHGMDWHLLAAIAYQESHWNPRAKSPTGVRGLMMLTLTTAREMGVKNRLDPLQSLEGGAKYFLKIKRRIPDDIFEPDRTWMALAAYNIGKGHLEDARVLTDRAGKNPHLWEDVKTFLPLLQKKKHYSTVKYGYARGGEAVLYVRNIRHFLSILRWNTLEEQRRQAREKLPERPASGAWGPDVLRPL